MRAAARREVALLGVASRPIAEPDKEVGAIAVLF